jgi:hypothetical protein
MQMNSHHERILLATLCISMPLMMLGAGYFENIFGDLLTLASGMNLGIILNSIRS